jgi:hypothetical protein
MRSKCGGQGSLGGTRSLPARGEVGAAHQQFCHPNGIRLIFLNTPTKTLTLPEKSCIM